MTMKTTEEKMQLKKINPLNRRQKRQRKEFLKVINKQKQDGINKSRCISYFVNVNKLGLPVKTEKFTDQININKITCKVKHCL